MSDWRDTFERFRCQACDGLVDCSAECPRGVAWNRATNRYRNEKDA